VEEQDWCECTDRYAYTDSNLNSAGMIVHVPIITAAVSQHKAEGGRMAIIKLLLANGANIESKTNKGMTSLMKACVDGNLDLVEFLLQSGADPNATTFDGITALMVAAQVSYFVYPMNR
jgi:ankyrin repeat protein